MFGFGGPRTKPAPRIRSVEVVLGDFDVRKLLPSNFARTREELRDEGIHLPAPALIDLASGSPYWLLLCPLLRLVVHTERDGDMVFDFRRGYVSDFASVPQLLRSALDNDDPHVVRAAWLHDLLHERVPLGRHDQGFEWTNSIFQQVIRLDGGSWWLGFKARLGVDSPEGRTSYMGHSRLEDHKNQFTAFEWVDKYRGPKCTE